jgi:putative heme iron utilization protein
VHGFDVEQGEAGARERVRFEFARPLSTPEQVRHAMVELVRATRAMGH